jgi:hypothetical protein
MASLPATALGQKQTPMRTQRFVLIAVGWRFPKTLAGFDATGGDGIAAIPSGLLPQSDGTQYLR